MEQPFLGILTVISGVLAVPLGLIVVAYIVNAIAYKDWTSVLRALATALPPIGLIVALGNWWWWLALLCLVVGEYIYYAKLLRG